MNIARTVLFLRRCCFSLVAFGGICVPVSLADDVAAAPPEPLFCVRFDADTLADGSPASSGRMPALVRLAGALQGVGAAGSGVSGKPADRAWDSSQNKGQGAQSPRNDARVTIDIPALKLAELKAFSLVFWFKTTQKTDDALRLFCASMSVDGAISNTQRGMVLRTRDGGLEMVFGNGKKALRAASAPASFDKVGEWMFVAVVWDGAFVYFYTQTTDQGIHPVGKTPFRGPLTNVPGPLIFGNHYLKNRGISGQMDNLRFFDSALSSAQLERLLMVDLSAY